MNEEKYTKKVAIEPGTWMGFETNFPIGGYLFHYDTPIREGQLHGCSESEVQLTEAVAEIRGVTGGSLSHYEMRVKVTKAVDQQRVIQEVLQVLAEQFNDGEPLVLTSREESSLPNYSPSYKAYIDDVLSDDEENDDPAE